MNAAVQFIYDAVTVAACVCPLASIGVLLIMAHAILTERNPK